MGDTPLDTPRKRPLGVTIIGTLLWIEAVFGATIGLITLIGGLGSELFILGIVATLLGFIELFIARGLLMLQRWAFWSAVIVEALVIVNSAFSLLQPRDSMAESVGTLILPVIILLYFLIDPNVRSAFRT